MADMPPTSAHDLRGLKDDAALHGMAQELALRMQPALFGGRLTIDQLGGELARAFTLAEDEIWAAIDLGIRRMIAEEEG